MFFLMRIREIQGFIYVPVCESCTPYIHIHCITAAAVVVVLISASSLSDTKVFLSVCYSLQEVISLTQELLSQNTKAKKAPEPPTAALTDSSSQGAHGDVVRESTAAGSQEAVPAHDWQVGDECLALWSTDGGWVCLYCGVHP